MPINEMIALQGQVGNPLNALAQGYKLGEFISDRPVRADLNTIKVDQGRANVDQTKAQTDFIKTQREKLARDSNFRAAAMGAQELASTPFEQWGSVLQRRMAEGASYGYEANAEREALEMLQTNPEALKGQVAGLVKFGQEAGIFSSGQTAWQRQFNSMTQGMTPEDKIKAQRIQAGLDPRAVASAPRTVDIGGVTYIVDPKSSTATLPTLNQPIGGGNQQGALPPPIPGQNPQSQPSVLGPDEVAANVARIEAEKNRAKVVGTQQGEKAVQGVMNAPTALNLMDDMDKGLQAQPESAFGRGVQSGLGFFGYGDSEKQAGMSVADTAGAQLMAYAEKLPGPASDADRQDFKASVGILASSVATRDQKRAALAQARKSFERLVQKYGSEGQSQNGGFPKTDPLSKNYDYEYDPATGSFK